MSDRRLRFPRGHRLPLSTPERTFVLIRVVRDRETKPTRGYSLYFPLLTRRGHPV